MKIIFKIIGYPFAILQSILWYVWVVFVLAICSTWLGLLFVPFPRFVLWEERLRGSVPKSPWMIFTIYSIGWRKAKNTWKLSSEVIDSSQTPKQD